MGGKAALLSSPPHDGALHPISKAEPCHPAAITNYSRLYRWPLSFRNHLNHITLGEGQEVDRGIKHWLSSFFTTTDQSSVLITADDPIHPSLEENHVIIFRGAYPHSCQCAPCCQPLQCTWWLRLINTNRATSSGRPIRAKVRPWISP